MVDIFKFSFLRKIFLQAKRIRWSNDLMKCFENSFEAIGES